MKLFLLLSQFQLIVTFCCYTKSFVNQCFKVHPAVASLARGIGGDGHTATDLGLLATGLCSRVEKNNAQKFA